MPQADCHPEEVEFSTGGELPTENLRMWLAVWVRLGMHRSVGSQKPGPQDDNRFLDGAPSDS